MGGGRRLPADPLSKPLLHLAAPWSRSRRFSWPLFRTPAVSRPAVSPKHRTKNLADGLATVRGWQPPVDWSSMNASWETIEPDCPVPATHRAVVEATLQMALMGKDYHSPTLFLAHLNAAIQALRNITFRLQAEKHQIPDFEVWYASERAALRRDPLMRRFHDARTAVVKQLGVESKSTFRSGLFRRRQMKLALGLNLPLMTESVTELKRLQGSGFAAAIVDAERSAIGEQLGVERRWVVEELGEEEVLRLCFAARNKLAELATRAHARCGSSHRCEPILCDEQDQQRYQVLLESDLDSSLPSKWGWDGAAEMIEKLLKGRD